MQTLNMSKGFKIQLSGRPDHSLIHLPEPDTVAVSGLDIPHIRPKLLVKEGMSVKTGTPIFCDKRYPDIHYVSPGTGQVKHIIFGARRKLWEVVIELSGEEEFESFPALDRPGLDQLPKADLVKQLKQGGLWQCFRQFPAKDVADAELEPPMIILSLEGNDLFSPRPGHLLRDREAAFRYGLGILQRFCPRIIITARQSSLADLGNLAAEVTHVVDDRYPAWDPGVVLYQIKKDVADNGAWSISLQHLLWMAQFLETGQFPTQTLVTVTKPGARKPHLTTRIGAPVNHVAGQLSDGDLITTGQFNGRIARRGSHMGFFETTLNVLPKGQEDEMFGFVRPGVAKPTVSNTFLSRLFKKPMDVDNTLHGEERPCINCSYCEKICPNDLMPSFIFKALLADDIKEALSLGLMDCCRCGLCAFACPSKIELTQILSQGMDTHHKDKF